MRRAPGGLDLPSLCPTVSDTPCFILECQARTDLSTEPSLTPRSPKCRDRRLLSNVRCSAGNVGYMHGRGVTERYSCSFLACAEIAAPSLLSAPPVFDCQWVSICVSGVRAYGHRRLIALQLAVPVMIRGPKLHTDERAAMCV